MINANLTQIQDLASKASGQGAVTSELIRSWTDDGVHQNVNRIR